MAIDTTLNQRIFKHGLTGYHQTARMIGEDNVRANKVFDIMDCDKKKPTETPNGQFLRIWNAVKRREFQEEKASKDEEKLSQWKHEFDVAPRITPERVKQMLDDMYDKGEISDQQHDWGYKGLIEFFGYIPEQELSIPF